LKPSSSPAPYKFDCAAYVQQPGAGLTQVMRMLQKILGAIA
jgi:hypothetical protein